MLRIIAVFLFAFVSTQAMAFDHIQLKTGHIFEGTVTKIEPCSVEFEFNAERYIVPAHDIEFVALEAPKKRTVKKLEALLNGSDNCWKGNSDGANHGHSGGQFLCGVAFGAFGVIGCAVTTRNPMKSSNPSLMSSNRELWNDGEYLNCYNKAAKSSAVSNSLLGWATWVLLILL